MTAASNALTILAAQAHGLMKSHASRWMPTYVPMLIRHFFASHVRRNGWSIVS